VVVHVRQFNHPVGVGIVDHAVVIIIRIEVDLDPWNPRLPGLGGSELRIVFGPGCRIDDDAREASVLAGSIVGLAIVDDVGLISVDRRGLEKNNALLGNARLSS
jgi:hypothetical protein